MLHYLQRRSRVILTLLFAGSLAMAVLSVVDRAYIPPDDALRHAATAVSGRSYTEVLVFDSDIPAVDSTPGWHRVLRAALHLPGMDKYGLISFSIFLLFMAFTVTGLLLVSRPEAWAGVLLMTMAIEPTFVGRLTLGRPYLLVSTATVVFAMVWDRLVADPRDRQAILWAAGVASVATWLHSTWFLLLAVPLAALVTRKWRAASTLWLCIAGGVLLGAILTLQPVQHLSYPVIHTWRTMANASDAYRVSELQPFGGAGPWVLLALLVLTARGAISELQNLSLRHPALVTAGAGWVLGFVAARFWIDIGLPAFMAALTLIVRRILASRLASGSPERWLVSGAVALGLLLAVSANPGRRWDASPLQRVVYFTEHPEEVAEWLPGPGGIIYSADMSVFFTLFFTYPDADWKYVLGLEKGIMPREDMAILHDIAERQNWDSFRPWVEKLRPEDRLFLMAARDGGRPDWEGVEIFDVPRSYSIVRPTRSRE
jgi:hypothetical protein